MGMMVVFFLSFNSKFFFKCALGPDLINSERKLNLEDLLESVKVEEKCLALKKYIYTLVAIFMRHMKS